MVLFNILKDFLRFYIGFLLVSWFSCFCFSVLNGFLDVF